MLEVTHPDVDKYIEDISTAENPVLKDLNRATYLEENLPHMVSGHPQGLFLTILAKSMNAKNILEIGSFTGYAAIALAQGMPTDGKLHTIEVDDEKEDIIRRYIEKAKLEDIIELHIGKALDIIPSLNTLYDIVFVDADKINNDAYFELCLPLLRRGGLLLIDNVLWRGKVTSESENDKMTNAIKAFNIKVTSDHRVQSVILPLRDGILMAQKL